MSRRKARDCAFKLVFEIPFHNNDYDARLNFFFENEDCSHLNEKDKKYISEVIKNCYVNLDKIDDVINKSLKGWTTDRLNKTSLSILRLAYCEFTYLTDIPYQVSINEAVELAKIYCDDNDPSFINGVLADIVKSEVK